MSGVKGRSGRKSTTEEQKRLRILNKAWDIIENCFDDLNLPIRDKIDVASKLVVKDLPQEVNGLSQQIVVMNEIKRDDEPLRYNIGKPDTAQAT